MMATAPTRNPSFFAVLNGEFQSKLRIPPIFVQYVFKGKVPSVFTLNSSDSESSWRVRVQIEQSDYFLIGDEWSKFVKDHSLETEDFLVFFLVDNSSFDVVTYNRSRCSRNIVVAAKKRDVNGPISVIRPTEEIDSSRFEVATNNRGTCSRNIVAIRARPILVIRPTKEISTKRCSSAPNREKAKGISKANNISEETASHPAFEIVMKDHHKYQIVLPRKFARKTGLGMESRIKIKDPRGNIWLVNIVQCGDQARLGRGLNRFFDENDIKVGDTLLFEHIQSAGNLLQVQVFHKQAKACEENTTVVGGKRGRGQSCRQVEEPPSKKCAPSSSKRTQDFTSRKTSFDLVLKEYPSYNASVPEVFAKETGLVEKSSTVIKGSDGRKWRSNILVDGLSYVRFGAGWSQFLEDNRLKVGDTISFWHIPNTGNVINFKITSKAGDGTRGKRST